MEGLRGYWRRKKYVRLDGSGRRRQSRVEISAAENGPARRRRFWRLKMTPRLRLFRIGSPTRFLTRIRDAYVKMMLSFAGSGAFAGGFAYAGGDVGRVGFGKRPMKEYDEKMIIEIYKSLVAQGQLMAREGGRLSAA